MSSKWPVGPQYYSIIIILLYSDLTSVDMVNPGSGGDDGCGAGLRLREGPRGEHRRD